MEPRPPWAAAFRGVFGAVDPRERIRSLRKEVGEPHRTMEPRPPWAAAFRGVFRAVDPRERIRSLGKEECYPLSDHFHRLGEMGARRPFFVKGTNLSDVYARERTLEREIAPAIERSLPGVEVLALELVSPSRFCVYVDHPGGVDHALCERVTRLLDDYRSEYGIDVSSPGPERPLRTRVHFEQALGRRVSIRTRSGKGKGRSRGEVVAAGEQAVTIRTNGVELTIPYDEIVRGNLIDEG